MQLDNSDNMKSALSEMISLSLGLCLAMQIIGNGIFMITLGVFLGIIGMCGALAAYPVYRKVFSATKEKYTPRILEPTEELSKTSN